MMENLMLLMEQANNADAVSQYKLGRAYEAGDGVEKNMATARAWYEKSAANGYKNAEVKLRLLPVQQEATAASVTDIPMAKAPTPAYQAPVAPKMVTPAAPQGTVATKVPAAGQKSKTVALVLAWCLGWIGAHDFYLGNKKKGFTKVLISLTVVGVFVTVIWGFLDFIKIICNSMLDSNGQLPQ